MKILYLGYSDNPVHTFLKEKNDVNHFEGDIKDIIVEEYDWIVSYGYTKIISKEIIDRSKNPIINLHISYLPFNRGSDPNFWSWLEDSPKGVTIHQIDSGLDTGDIFIQKEVKFNEDETLSSSYQILRNEIESLFIDIFYDIISGKIKPVKQNKGGSYHRRSDLEKYKHLLSDGWNTPVKLIRLTDLDIISEIENVRSRNNVNWMDILRLAFKYAPDEARLIISKINSDDGKISNLLNKLSKNR
jgi:methionyl-tRNA formyltransferase